MPLKSPPLRRAWGPSRTLGSCSMRCHVWSKSGLGLQGPWEGTLQTRVIFNGGVWLVFLVFLFFWMINLLAFLNFLLEGYGQDYLHKCKLMFFCNGKFWTALTILTEAWNWTDECIYLCWQVINRKYNQAGLKTVLRTLFFKADIKSQLSDSVVSWVDFYCGQLAVLWKVNNLLISLWRSTSSSSISWRNPW